MKNKLNRYGAFTGPGGKTWSDWRERRTKAILKPRKSGVTERLEKINAKPTQSAKPGVE
jgi:hypothetical protein